jgi:hypothetical protein
VLTETQNLAGSAAILFFLGLHTRQVPVTFADGFQAFLGMDNTGERVRLDSEEMRWIGFICFHRHYPALKSRGPQ